MTRLKDAFDFARGRERRQPLVGDMVTATVEGPPRWDRWEKRQSRMAQAGKRLAITPPRLLLWITRAVPAPKFFRFVFVGRYSEVLEVLGRPDVFEVPFASEVARLHDGSLPGTPYLLGVDDRTEHDRQVRHAMSMFRRADIATIVTLVEQHATDCVQSVDDRKFDVMRGLITETALAICERYFGVAVGDKREERFKFACSVYAVSGHLFGPPPIKPEAEADKAAAYLRYFVDRAIDAALTDAPSLAETIVARLVEEKATGGSLPDPDRRQIRALLMDMIVALLPNGTMVGQHVLEILLKNRQAMNDAEIAACNGDDARLECILFEALRFMPLNAGPFRTCARDYVLAEGTPFEKLVRKGTTVVPLLFSAMFDPRRVVDPGKYDPTRAKSDHLHFSFGMHACLGLMIGRAHLTQTFKVLLRERCAIRQARRTRLRMRGVVPILYEVSSSDRKSRPTVDLDPQGRLR